MLTWKQTEAGTIREWNQDRLVLNEDQGQLLFADGHGPAGRELAETAIERLLPLLTRIQAQARVEGSPERVARAIQRVLAEIDQKRLESPLWSASRVELGAALVIEGHLALAIAGRVGFMALTGDELTMLEPEHLPSLAEVTGLDLDEGSAAPDIDRARATQLTGLARRADGQTAVFTAEEAESPDHAPSATIRTTGPLPLTVGDWVMLCSQGMLVSQPFGEIAPLAPAVRDEPERIAAALFQRATQRYDGDDRTMALLRILPNDLRSRLSHDVVLETHIDRRYRIPLWAPLAAMIGVVWFALRLWRGVSGWWQDE